MSKKWVRAAAIRAIRTAAQTAVAILGTTAATATLSQIDWGLVVSTAILSGILSVLTSIAGLPEVGAGEAPEYNTGRDGGCDGDE